MRPARVTRVALIGCGAHMRSTLIPTLRMLMSTHTVEVCVDINIEHAMAAQALTRAAHVATSFEDVEATQVDAALVAVPAPAAYEIVGRLIKRGVATFVEKPPASATAEIENLWNLAQQRRSYVQVGFNFRYADAVVALRETLAPYVGQACLINVDFRSRWPAGPQWGRQDPIEAWMYHNGIHAFDLLNWMAGPVSQVQAHRIVNPGQQFLICGLATHRDGSVSTLRFGNLTRTFDIRADVITPDGNQFLMPHLGEVVVASRNGLLAGDILYRTRNLDISGGRAGYLPELAYFFDHFDRYESCSPSLFDALQAFHVCDAILSSLDKSGLHVERGARVRTVPRRRKAVAAGQPSTEDA